MEINNIDPAVLTALKETINKQRNFLKCPDLSVRRGIPSDQRQGLPNPPVVKEATGKVIALPPFPELVHPTYQELLDMRRSMRAFDETVAMTQEQLAFMLWSCQGIQAYRGENRIGTLRPVPCGGARHEFELYALVQNVAGLEPGVYHYLPQEHVGVKGAAVELVKPLDNIPETVTKMLAGQSWGGKAQVILFFTCIPYRAEWRYSETAHRVILIDLGHAGQHVMLSATALGLGSCCLAAYDVEYCDEVLGVDGEEEFTIYAIPVGVVKQG